MLGDHLEEHMSALEITIFSCIHYALYLLRIIATGYFIYMTVKYSRLQGEMKDKYTIYTFVLLGISTSSFLVHGLFSVTLRVL